jgi:hypothetical protein
MKTFTGYRFFFWLLLITSIWLTGCSEDISVINPGPPIPVIYGVFDLNEATHFVKLSKTFAGKSDPYTLALNRDQVYYSDARIYLFEENGSGGIEFQKDSDIPRNAGSFPAYPNESFVLNKQLSPGNYRITVILPTEKDTLKGSFSLLNSFRVITPKAGFRRFYLYEDPILYSWDADPAAGLFEIALNLTYEEWMKTGESKRCSVSFTRQLGIPDLEFDNNRYSYRFFSDSFFAFLGVNIKVNDSIDYRKPVGLELVITEADTTLARYLRWFDLEIDDKVNPNGNVEGAIGVIGSKFSVPFSGLILSARSQDSLVRGRYTKKLDFVNNPDW